MHAMSFHFGYEETILFETWRTTDATGIIGSSLGIILMGMIYEGLKNYREYLGLCNSSQKATDPHFEAKNSVFNPIHVLQTFLHIIQLILGYFLMFVFMTFNVYLCTAVIVGCTFGYFVFAWKYPKSNIVDCCS